MVPKYEWWKKKKRSSALGYFILSSVLQWKAPFFFFFFFLNPPPYRNQIIFSMNSQWCEGCSSCPDIRTSSPSFGWTVMAEIDVKNFLKILQRFSRRGNQAVLCDGSRRRSSRSAKRERQKSQGKKEECLSALLFSADAPRRTERAQRACAKPPPCSIPNGQTFSHAHLRVQELGGGKHWIQCDQTLLNAKRATDF